MTGWRKHAIGVIRSADMEMILSIIICAIEIIIREKNKKYYIVILFGDSFLPERKRIYEKNLFQGKKEFPEQTDGSKKYFKIDIYSLKIVIPGPSH